MTYEEANEIVGNLDSDKYTETEKQAALIYMMLRKRQEQKERKEKEQ